MNTNDLISRQAAIKVVGVNTWAGSRLSALPSAQSQQELITWLLDEIWDDDAWEVNCVAFPELLCRKLVKLGYVAIEGGAYVRIDKQTGDEYENEKIQEKTNSN